MRGLMAAVIGMGILIVAGVTVIAVVMVQRLSSAGAPGASPAEITLDEPGGTRIDGSAAAGERILVQLTGGGRPDRLVIVDTRAGRVVGRVGLAR